MSESNVVPFWVIEDPDAITSRGIELTIRSKDDITQIVNVVARRWDVRYLEELNDFGGGTFMMRPDDVALTDSPTLLDVGNVVQVNVGGVTVGWWTIRDVDKVTVSTDEYSGEMLEVSGPGLGSVLGNAVVYPEGGIHPSASESRLFNFAGPSGAWYDPLEWTTAFDVATKFDGFPVTTSDNTYENWPFTSQWIWDRDSIDTAPEGDVFFRREFTTVGDKDVRIWITCQDIAAVYVDGARISSITEFGAWKRFFTSDFELPAGDHVLAVRGRNRTGNRSGVNVVLAEVPADDTADYTDANRIVWTGDGSWLCNGYPDPSPGWSTGLIMKTLIDEAIARSVAGYDLFTVDFTDTLDSYGVEWNNALDWEWDVGAKYSDILDQMTAMACDAWLDRSLTLRMVPERGFDRSIQNAGIQPVVFTKGLNLIGAQYRSDNNVRNLVLMKTSEGFSETAEPTDSLTKYGRREAFLSTGDASSNGLVPKLAQQLFDKYSELRKHPTIKIYGDEQHLPWMHFDVGDWVLAPDDDDVDTLVKRRIVSISVQEDRDTGNVEYECEVDSIQESADQRIERWLRGIDSGSFSAGVVGASSRASSGDPFGASVPVSSGTPGPRGIQGLRGLTFRGVWSSVTSYVADDLVTRAGQSWLALDVSTNVTPSESAYWTLAAAKGSQGDIGVSLLYRGLWNSGTAYAVGDLVLYGGMYYVGNAASTNKTPGVDVEWDLFQDPGGTAGGGGDIRDSFMLMGG